MKDLFIGIKMYKAISILMLVLTAFSVNAGEELDKAAVQLSVSAGNVSAQRQLIESKIVQIEYQEMLSADRALLLSQLEAIDSGAVTGNTVVVYQDKINSILSQSFADSKLVCRVEKPTGSVRNVRVCMTVAAKNRKHKETQSKMNAIGPTIHTANQ